MKVVLDHVKIEAPNISSFYFRPPKKIDYTAGQFIEMTLPHYHPDERGIRHWFTLSSSPTKPLISITTKFAGEGSSSFKQALFALEPGAEVEISDPMGDFVLPKDPQRSLVFVAGGIGITPFRSIFEWLVDSGEKRVIKFIYGVRSTEEIVFEELAKAAGAPPMVVVSEPTAGWKGRTGRLSAELILELAKPGSDTLVYVSGPEPMVEALEADLKKVGLAQNQLVLDFFPNYKDV